MTTVANRPLVMANKPIVAAAAKPVVATAATAAATPSLATSDFNPSIQAGIDTVGRVLSGGRFTPPVIVDIAKSSVMSAFRPMAILQNAGFSIFRNVKNLTQGKISVARAGGNVVTETTIGVAKGIGQGIVAQSVAVAMAPVLGMLPIAASAIPFVSIGVGIAALIGTNMVMNKVIRSTGIDQKMSDAITKALGGDKPGTAPSSDGKTV